MDAEATESAVTKTKRTWPAYVVLALCGAPIFIMAAWKTVCDTPVQSLMVELDAEGNATLTANRRWTTEVRTVLLMPRDGARLYDAMEPFMREAERDFLNSGLPICPVRVVVPGDARAGLVNEAIVTAMRCYLWEMTLESGGYAAALALPKCEGGGLIRALPPPRDVSVAGLGLPHDDGEWASTALHLAQALALDSWTLTCMGGSPGAGSSVAEEIADRTVVRDLDDPGVGVLDAPEWQALVGAADEKKTTALAAPEDADLSGVDGAHVLADADARAGDLVRALAFLTSHEGLKVYLVWPEREGPDDWWLAP